MERKQLFSAQPMSAEDPHGGLTAGAGREGVQGEGPRWHQAQGVHTRREGLQRASLEHQ